MLENSYESEDCLERTGDVVRQAEFKYLFFLELTISCIIRKTLRAQRLKFTRGYTDFHYLLRIRQLG